MEESFAAGQRVRVPKWKKGTDKVGRQYGTVAGAGLWKEWYRVKADDGKYYQVHKDVITEEA